MSARHKYPQWFDGHKLNEILFCETFLKEHSHEDPEADVLLGAISPADRSDTFGNGTYFQDGY